MNSFSMPSDLSEVRIISTTSGYSKLDVVVFESVELLVNKLDY